MQPSKVNDDLSVEVEIDTTELGLKGGRLEDLKEWRQEANRKKSPEGRKWELVVRLVHVIFKDGTVTEEIPWETMVLIPKEKGDYRGIGIVEVLWKACSVVVNCRLKKSVVFHDSINGFREGRGDGDGNVGVQAGTASGRDCTRAPLPGIPGCTKGL